MENNKIDAFIERNYKRLVIIFIIVSIVFAGYKYYQYKNRQKMIEQMVQEKVDEIISQQGTNNSDNTDNSINEIFDGDLNEIVNDFSVNDIKDYIENDESFRKLFSEEEMKELTELLDGLSGLEDIFKGGNN